MVKQGPLSITCMTGLPHEKVNKIGSNPILRSQIQSHLVIDLAFSFNLLMQLVQSQTIPDIANPPGGTIIHMSREPDSTTTLVCNNSGSLDGTIHTRHR